MDLLRGVRRVKAWGNGEVSAAKVHEPWCGGLEENDPQREWHYEEVWLVGEGEGLLEEVWHCGEGL